MFEPKLFNDIKYNVYLNILTTFRKKEGILHMHKNMQYQVKQKSEKN